MEWKDSDASKSLEHEPDGGGDTFEDEDYPIWQKPKKRSLGEKLFNKLEMPFVVMGAGLLIVIILFVVSISGKESTQVGEQVASMEQRLHQIEKRLNNLELTAGGGKRIEVQNSKLAEFNDKISRLESSIALRMDQLAADINRTRKQASSNRSPRTSVKASSSSGTKPVLKSASTKYHQVRAGETLYSIGKRYGLKVSEMRKLNSLKTGSVIHPGQKLIVGR